MIDALPVAKYMVTHKSITNLCLQYYLYMLQIKYLQQEGEPLFDNEIKAYKFGPCMPDIYYYYCGSGAMTIFPFENSNEIVLPKPLQNLVDEVLKETDQPFALRKKVAPEGGAWQRVFSKWVADRQADIKAYTKLPVYSTITVDDMLQDIEKNS